MLTIRALFVALFAFCLGNAANFTSTHGKLKVSGGKILDKNNNEVVLRGMSLYWYQGPWSGNQPGDQFYITTTVSNLANNWGANVVRAAIGNVQQNSSSALTMAKSMMDWANSAGIYVIIDNHSHIAHRSAHATAARNFFRDVSAYVKEKSYTHVLYEIYNEPVYDCDNWNPDNCTSSSKTTWAQIKTFSEAVIDTIRKNDSDGLIIVGTPDYSSRVLEPKSESGPGPITGTRAHNVLYTLHFYAGTTGHNSYKEYVRKAYCDEFPIFVTEWGTSAASGTGTINTSNSNSWISLLEAAKVSHANWSLSNSSETSAALTGTSVTATGGTTNSGTYIRNILKLNSGSSLADVGLTKETIDCSGPPEVAGPNGRISFGTNGSLANFANKSGADSVSTKFGAALENTSANFSAEYTFIGIEKPGIYFISFYAASTAGGTVSWSGSGISGGQAQIKNTGSLETFEYTEPQLITVVQTPETPLNLSFQTSSAKSLRAVYVYTYELSEEDSLSYDIANTIKTLNSGKHWSYSASAKSFVFESNEGSLEIYSLRGEKIFTKAAQGSISLAALPPGAYLAIYRRGSNVQHKTIYLK